MVGLDIGMNSKASHLTVGNALLIRSSPDDDWHRIAINRGWSPSIPSFIRAPSGHQSNIFLYQYISQTAVRFAGNNRIQLVYHSSLSSRLPHIVTTTNEVHCIQ